MFVIKQSDTYGWTVSVKYPITGNKYKTETFTGEFKRLPQSRIKEIMKQIENDQMGDKDLAKEVLVGWKDVSDENGNEIPFSEATLEKLLDVQLVAGSIARAFIESISGAKIKN